MRARLAALLLLLALPAAAQPSLRRIGAEGGDFRVELSDGAILRGQDLVGAVLELRVNDAPLLLRVDSAAPDQGGRATDVWLFRLVMLHLDGRAEPFCQPDPDGHSLAIPHDDGAGGLALTCSSGAIGKCMRAGYRPWAQAPDGRTSLAPHHAACVNMFRGAYGGPERPFTRDGMRIDLYDRLGIQAPDNDPADAFEAGWTAEGAVCLAHPRVPENGSLDEIVAAVPRLAGWIGPETCTEERAAAWGALVFNRSRPPSR